MKPHCGRLLVVGLLIVLFGLGTWSTVAIASSCYESTIRSPTPFMGNNGEIFKLDDGSIWEVMYEYEYLYEYYPSVIACPDLGKIIVDGKKLGAKLHSAAGETPSEQETIDSSSDGQSGGWETYEETNVKGTIKGTIKKGTVIEMRSGGVYQVRDRVRFRVRERKPDAIVLRDGRLFKVIIDGFDEPLICVQLAEPRSTMGKSQHSPATAAVIHSYIDDDFEGWDGETIFKLDNGQIWQQSSYAYTYHYAYRPEVMIFNDGVAWRMKVDGVDEMVEVTRLK